MGAFEPCAACTICTICARTVSRPTRVARKTKLPVVLIVAPITWSPGRFTTGIGSPVSIASSTAEPPSVTRPSTGTFSPGRTRIRSPGRTVSMATSVSPWDPTRRAVRAWRPMRLRTAPSVCDLARASSQRPARISPTIRLELSKYVTGSMPARVTSSGQMVTAVLYPQAAVVPSATSVFMFTSR